MKRRVATTLAALVATACTSGSPDERTAPTPTSTPPVGTLSSDYSGWNRANLVFRLTWTTAADGTVAGSLHVVRIRERRVLRRSLTVSGRQAEHHLQLRLSQPVEGTRAFHGTVTPGRLLLIPSRDDLEDTWLGSPVAVRRSFARHVVILRGPGGYDGWRFRRQRSRAAVHRVDVDGDGRQDLVVLAWANVRRQVREVFVHFATGAIASARAPANLSSVGSYGANGWVGATHIPGMTGHQIVLLNMAGAADVFYSVVADVGGRLVRIDAPGFDGDWDVGGTVGTGSLGSFCRNGRVYVWSIHGYWQPGSHRGTRLRINSYVWRHGWALVTRVRREVTSAQLRRLVPSSGVRPLTGCS